MKQKNLKQIAKFLGIVIAMFLMANAVNAQTTTAPISNQTLITNTSLPVVGTGRADGGAVRLVDNKGTIKYLQVQNGITQITNTNPGGVTTTWQLGGALTANTYISAVGGEFALDSIKLVSITDTAAAANVIDRSVHSGTAQAKWAVLVRDETTGAIEKIAASDLLQVTGGEIQSTITSGAPSPALSDATIPAAYQKVSVYRNGAKLIANQDYTVSTGSVTLNAGNSTGTNGDWSLIDGDIIEVQWVR